MNKKDWLDELNKYDVVRIPNLYEIPNLYDYEDYIFKSAQTSYCYLAEFHRNYVNLGKQYCLIQYYGSRQYKIGNKKDFGRYARHLKTLKRQLDRAIYDKKNYLMENKLKKMDKDF